MPANFGQLAQSVWYWPVVRGVLTALFGLVAIFAPIDTSRALVQVFGVFVMVDGLVNLIDGIRRKGTAAGTFNTTLGVLGLGFGLVLVLLPNVAIGVVLLLIALWAFVIGAFQLVVSLGVRRAQGGSWIWGAISGVLLIALAVTCVVKPSQTVSVLAVIVGIFAVVTGIVLIVLGFRLRDLGKHPEHAAGVFGAAGPGATGPGSSRQGEVIEGEIVIEGKPIDE
ncbi:hypothetical protein Slu03_23870 [Sediminihabitans luteus]|nr:hypothetical protein Slu03_23870 [Sediminihabitans luteus]